MPTAQRRPREPLQTTSAPLQTRSQLGFAKMLEAGRALIEENGNLDDLSITDIVERAGTSIGAFYRRFDNKDTFFDVVQDGVIAEGLDNVREALTSDAVWQSNEAGAIADATIQLYLRAFRRNRGLYHASLLRASQRKSTWDAIRHSNDEVQALIVPKLVDALVPGTGPKAARAALEFEVLAALQLMLGMLVNSVLNDPGPLSLTSRRLAPYLQRQFRRCLDLPAA
ncbi:TetR/AcrR family transcriptional regulator [Paraburkholderia sp.]|uniref:TetR/AcrR family transcriptional regulator n=1 Tax=Paraburkholderia sp. TaxID=1926495 RepID=UPI002579E1DB|nr:TetR/AcrR family transcriptional regulator [Paraburkholderia sp.]